MSTPSVPSTPLESPASLAESGSASLRFVVVATYNEKANIPQLIPAIFQAVPDATLIIVDDNSPDGSPELLRQMAAEDPRLRPIIREGKGGYGGAMRRGFQEALAAGATELATLDADFSHNPESLPQMFSALQQADIAIGSRYSGGVRVLNWHPSRLLLSLFANRYVAFILGMDIADATSGYRAYRRHTLEAIPFEDIRSTGYSFLVEILYRLKKQGYQATEVPIIYTERREGQSKMDRSVIFEAILRPWILRLKR